jgi:hypothetical protein
MPLSTLRNIIQTGGESLQTLASQTGERITSVFRRDKEGDAGEPAAEPAPASANQHASLIREFLERSQQTFDEWQKKVDERIRSTVEAINPMASLEKEMKALAQRVSELERWLGDE